MQCAESGVDVVEKDPKEMPGSLEFAFLASCVEEDSDLVHGSGGLADAASPANVRRENAIAVPMLHTGRRSG